MTTPRDVVLIGGLRLPFTKMGTGLADLDILELLVPVLNGLVSKYNLSGETLGDVALGTAFFDPKYWNVSRDAVLRTSLHPHTPAMGLQRACATSFEAAITIANKIAAGQIESGIAGGVESMTNISIFLRPGLARRMVLSSKAKTFGQKLQIWKGLTLHDLKPTTAPGVELSTGKSMGEGCEIMAKTWKIGRKEQDELALKSHQTAAKAFKDGFYEDLIIEHNGVKFDNNVRSDTSLEKLAKLPPAFDFSGTGTLTAGNSSPFTDGAGAVLLASESWARERKLPILARIIDFETTAVDIKKEGLLMAPAYAAPRLLKRQNMKLQDFDFYEIHEAFTAQVLCTLKAWETPEFGLGSIDLQKMNVVGGSVALGHPFGATGARILSSLGKLLHKKGKGARGFASICTGGGMGTVMILESYS